MQIEYTLVRELRPYSRNARTHSRKQIRLIADSIKRFGFNNAVLIDGNNQIIAGHGRVEAAKLLGLQAVPTVKLSHLSEDDKRAFILADNKLALKAGWDRETLAIELQGLIDLGCDIEVTGFETAEVDVILEEAAEATEAEPGPEDAVPAVADRAVTQPGDVWLLGQHRLICGGSRSAETYEQLVKGMKAEFVFTDPPYNVRIDGNVTGLGRIRHREFAMASGEMTEAEFTVFLEGVFRQLALNSVDGSIHQVCMDWRHISEMMNAGRKIYTDLKNLCVWNKSSPGMGSFYRSQHELTFVWKNGDGVHVNNFELGQHGRTRTNVWNYPGMAGGGAGRLDQLALHPTVKPVALVADAIKDCSHRGGVVLDPFCGSGTILIAAQRTGRKARAIELDPVYVDVAVRRWQLYTGKAAKLARSDRGKLRTGRGSTHRRTGGGLSKGETMDHDEGEKAPENPEVNGLVEPAGPAETASYAVGYGKPPVATRFKPKRSGNPAGRKKKKAVIEDARTTVEEFFDETVKVRDGGRTRRLTKMEATINILRMNALKGSSKHAKALFALAKKTGQFTKSARKSSIVLTEPGSDSEKRLLQIFHARKPDHPTLMTPAM